MNTESSELRINARLTGADALRFRELQNSEGLSASDLLRDALRAYHAERLRPRAQAAQLLKTSGFIGGGEGPVDLSERYKDYLADALEHKYPLRVQDR
jgi:hypothetical protein